MAYLSNFFPLLLLLSIINVTYQCARTSPGTTPVVTACNSCTNDQVTLLSQSDGTKAFTSDVTGTANDCRTRTLVCDANEADAQATITVNDGENGEIPATGTTSVTLTCNSDGVWVIPPETVAITELECIVAG